MKGSGISSFAKKGRTSSSGNDDFGITKSLRKKLEG